MTSPLAGVDGCRGGWAVALLDPSVTDPRVQFHVCKTFVEAMDLVGFGIAAVDIPIGLLDEPQPGGRTCDHTARRFVPGRSSSVFSAPSRRVLQAQTYDQARGGGLTKQGFHLLPKIREVDAWITPERQDRVYESHPEVAFCQQFGGAVPHSKHTEAGKRLRRRILRAAKPAWFKNITRRLKNLRRQIPISQVSEDDWIDACILLITAQRITNGTALRIPAQPGRDSRGLRMEIWA